MKIFVALLALLLCTALIGSAQMEQMSKAKVMTLKGYVVDQGCAGKMAQKADVMEKAAGHSKDCSLEDACAAAGYGIFSDGKYYKFDEKGSAKAKAMIEKSKRTKGLYFEAKGKMGDGTFELTSLKEAKPMAEKKMEKM